MKSFTNHTPGPRGLNVKGKDGAVTTRWMEPGETFQLDDGEEVHGNLPDLGKPADAGDKALDRVAELEAALATSEARVAELETGKSEPKPWMIAAAVGQLDAKNDDHWTAAGLPKVEAVEALLDASVTRDDIKAAAPEAKRAA